MSRNGMPPEIPEIEIAEKLASSRNQPSCSTCDFMRREGPAMRCYHEPPVPVLLGTVPNKIAGAPQQLVITGISPEVHDQRFCRYHPLLRGPIMPGAAGQLRPSTSH